MARFVTFLLGALVGAAAGFAAGTLVMPPDEVPDDGVSRPFAASAPVAEGVREDHPAERRAEGRARRTGADPLLPSDFGDLGSPETGTGVVTGRVVDGAGKPLEGVMVRAFPEDDPPEEAFPPTTDPDEELRRDIRSMVRRHRWRQLRERSAATSASGHYRIEGLADREWDVRAAKEGWEFQHADTERRWATVRPGANVIWIGRLRLDLGLTVLLPDGRPAEEAQIESRRRENPESSSSESWSPSSPRVTLEPGAWRLTAFSGEHSEFSSEDVHVEVVDGQPPAPLTMRLRERRGVLVHVGAAGPEGPMKVRVQLVREGTAAEAQRQHRTRRNGGETDTWVAPTEQAAFLDTPPGRYALVASLRGVGEIHRETVEIADRLLRREIPLPPGELRDWVAVALVAPDGSPIQRASFQGGYESDDGSSSGDVEAARLPDGRWRIAHFDTGTAGNWSRSGNANPAGAETHWVQAASDLWGRVRAEYRIGVDRELTLRFSEPARLDVTVADAESLDARALVVEVESVGDDEGQDSFSDQREIAEGQAHFGPLPVRAFVVSLLLRDENWRRTEIARTRVTLSAGDNSLALAIPALQALRVTLPPEIGDDEVSLRQLREDGGTTWIQPRSAEHGSRTFGSLPPGRYRLSHDELGEMTISLPGPADVRFAPKPWNAVRFNVDDHGPAHDAGLRDGDVGLALDGTAFENPRQMNALFAAAQLKSKCRLTVQRGTQRVDLELDAAKLADDLDWDLATR